MIHNQVCKILSPYFTDSLRADMLIGVAGSWQIPPAYLLDQHTFDFLFDAVIG
jgi:hypothetical protein